LRMVGETPRVGTLGMKIGRLLGIPVGNKKVGVGLVLGAVVLHAQQRMRSTMAKLSFSYSKDFGYIWPERAKRSHRLEAVEEAQKGYI